MMGEGKKLVPKRRFREFRDAGDWEQRKLGEVADFSKGNGYSKNDLVKSGLPIILYGRLYTKYETTISEVDTFVNEKKVSVYSRGGEVIVPASGETAEDISRASVVEKSGILLGGDLNIIEPYKELEPTFLALNITNGTPHKEMSKLAQGKSVVHLHNSDLEKIDLFYPSYMEQAVISNFFRTIDNTITLHKHNLEKLEALKTAYLSEMFPAEGEHKPKRRFKGFTNAWEQRKFVEVYSYMQNNTLSRAELSYQSGIAKNIHYGDVLIKFGECLDVSKVELPMITNETAVTKFKTSFLQDGDIIIADTAEDETVGKACEVVGLNNEKVLSGLHTIPCRPNRKFASGYLGYYMNSSSYHDQLLPLMQGIKVTSVSRTSLQNTEVLYPKEIDEQRQIGVFFRQLDNTITLHKRKLQKLQNIKTAFLTELFPGGDQ